MRILRSFLCLLLFSSASLQAQVIQIDGPKGPLSGEVTSAKNAQDIVIIIPGSGPVDRDGNNAQMTLHSDTYKLLAEGLKRAGISSLRIDKRGMYGSSKAIANPNDVTIDAYAQDLEHWITRAAALAPHVWVAGHSEGGLVALVAAQDPPRQLSGLILLSTAGRPLGQLLREQFRSNPANATLMPEIDALVTQLEAGHHRDPASISPVLRPLFSDALQPFWINVLSYDPVDIAQDWHGPAMIIQGDADSQVKPLDAALLAKAMPQAKRVNLAGATHMLKLNVAGKPLATYTDPTLPLHPDLVPSIVNFVKHNQASRDSGST